MSDFDKEAERQRLREKYERDETKRQSTQRMSELLLKGATMTNKRCNNCGDPLFRYEGQAFCPTCQVEGQAAANADRDAEQATEAAVEADESEVEAEAEANANETAASAGSTEAADETRRNPTSANGCTAAPTRTQTAGEREATERRTSREVVGDVTAARKSLVRTLTWAAEQAESTDDPRWTTKYLTAVREAAEAISALDR